MLSIRLSLIRCDQETSGELGDDDPYVMVTTVR